MTKTVGGRMYERDALTGRIVKEVPRDTGIPDVVVCRRLRDYPTDPRLRAAALPETAAVTGCSRCGFAIAFNPLGPHQDRPKVCMQCAQIQPLPIEGA